MLENVEDFKNLIGLSRRKSKSYEIKAIHPSDRTKYENDGW